MLTAKEKSSYELIVAALKKRFHSLDIEELRGLEFHQLMQDKQTVEEVGVRLQKLARKAFPDSNPKEFDRMLKGRFYQALLPKWQRKLGAPKAAETFDDLYGSPVISNLTPSEVMASPLTANTKHPSPSNHQRSPHHPTMVNLPMVL